MPQLAILTLAAVAVLMAKHAVADFYLQTPYQFLNKGTYGHPGGFLHAGIHAALTPFVYLVLVAQYESFILPLAVVLSLPVGLFGSFFFLQAVGLTNDVYAQIGLIMLVGLLGKNAVLMVEFAVQKHHDGSTVLQAAIEGAKVRFRPILMTSFAFIAGLIPLVRATGPGALGNRTIGASALGGMLFGTVFGVIIVPGLYYIFGTLSEGRALIREEEDRSVTEEITHHA